MTTIQVTEPIPWANCILWENKIYTCDLESTSVPSSYVEWVYYVFFFFLVLLTILFVYKIAKEWDRKKKTKWKIGIVMIIPLVLIYLYLFVFWDIIAPWLY